MTRPCHPPHAKRSADPTNEPLVSAASLWEIAIKRALGKLTAPDDLPDPHHRARAGDGSQLNLGTPWQVRDLPAHHRDPFDRILIAQALIERLPVLTIDARFSDYEIQVRW